MYVCMYVCICMYVCMDVCMYIYILHTHIHDHTHAYTLYNVSHKKLFGCLLLKFAGIALFAIICGEFNLSYLLL